jgi:2-C-methyl-D-erythritol 4-phosphate cytidylyltransferase/2-C-methyl-D-erythritol 2,4-cyclodiphosphate synthase
MDLFDGLVSTGPRTAALGGCRWQGPELAESTLQCLLAGLRAVPADVPDVVFFEGSELDVLVVDEVVEMLTWLTSDVAAVVRGAPVTDALKRVEGDRLIGAVERDGLLTLQTPHVIRRDALDEALLVMPDGGPQDPAALLIATGHPVRMFHPAPVRHPAHDVEPATR